MPPIRRALLSVTDKTDLADFALGLTRHGVEIISTGGTAKALRAAGIEVRDVSDVTGFPEMMDGRLKTLHPRVHGGLLAIRAEPAHQAAMIANDIPPIDLLVVSLYPFEATLKRGASFDDWVVAAICLASIVVIMWATRIRRLPFSGGIVMAIGGMTYPFYLLHQQVGYDVLNRVGPNSYPMIFVAVISCGIALLS